MREGAMALVRPTVRPAVPSGKKKANALAPWRLVVVNIWSRRRRNQAGLDGLVWLCGLLKWAEPRSSS